MATESWSGGRISSEETPGSRSPRGGYIPLADIPNADRLRAPEMPLARYQPIPSIRHEYITFDPNMEAKGQKLMQKELPGSFEQAGEIRTRAAGEGQKAWGKAIESGGEQVSKALGTFSNVLARLQHEALKSKDETDKLKFDKDENWYQGEIDNITKTKPYEEWAPEKKKLDEKLTKLTSNYGTTPVTKERIALRRASLIGTPDQAGWADSRFQSATATRQLQADLKFNTEAIEENRKNGKSADSELSYKYLEDRGYYSKDQVKLEKQKDAQVEGQIHFANAMQLNPRPAMNEAKKVLDGGTSKDFPHLNKANAANYFVEAQNATRVKDQQTVVDLSTQFANGQITDPKEVERRARQAGLPDEDVLKLTTGIAQYQEKARKDAEQNIKLDPAAVVGARSVIMDYDANADADGKKFTAGVDYINSNLPPEMRAHFIEKLKAKTPEANQKKAPEALAREREVDSISKEIKELGDKGLQFTDEGKRDDYRAAAKKLKDGKDLDAKELAIWREGNQWIDDKLNEVDAAAAKELDFAPGDLRTKIRKDMAPEIQKNIGTSNPAAPPPRATPNPTALTREQLAAAPGIVPSEWVATAPRDLSAGGRGGSPAFQQAFVSGGERHDMEATAYTKHEPGGDQVKAREGPLFTMEKYAKGLVPYVSASMDDKSDLQGKYLISTSHPNVVFKVEDRGGAFVGKGNTRIDVAYDNRRMETEYKSHGTWKVISEEEALNISGSSRRGVAGLNKQRGDMGTLAGTDQQKIVSLKPEAQGPISSFVSAAKSWGEKNGYEVSIAEGYRSPERQAELYAQGRTKPGNIVTNAKPGQSNHQSGRAIDLVVTKNGRVVDDERVWAQLGKIGQGMGLEWGGTWKSIHDPEHFQVNG